MFPNNMRSGIGGFYNDGRATSIEEIIECILFVLLKDCLTKMVEYYYRHGIVNDDTDIDVGEFKQFLKLSTMLFVDTPDINQRVNDAIERYTIIRNNFDDEMMDIDLELNDEPNQPVHNCNCSMCQTMERIEFEWMNWNPMDGFLILLKESINRFDVESAIQQL